MRTDTPPQTHEHQLLPIDHEPVCVFGSTTSKPIHRFGWVVDLVGIKLGASVHSARCGSNDPDSVETNICLNTKSICRPAAWDPEGL